MTSLACPPGACEMGRGCGGPGSTDTPCGGCCDCRGCAAFALAVADTPLSRVERFLNILPPGEPVLTAVVVDDEGTVVTLHTSDVRAVIADLWAARDLAFRAAFADEEGAEVEAQWYADANPRHVGWIPYRPELWPETTTDALGLISAGVAFRRRTIGPWQAFTPDPTWRPVPAVPQEKP